jgi:hypothetical protein
MGIELTTSEKEDFLREHLKSVEKEEKLDG